MSLNPQAPQKPNGLAVALLAFPFVALEAAGSRIASAFNKKAPSQPKAVPAPAFEQRLPDITANQQYMIADRVHSAEVNGRKVSFYQYHAAGVIRISCRELRHLKPIEFTPALAESAALVYDIDGAIQWVRKNGLESEAAKRAAPTSRSKAAPPPAQADAPPLDVNEVPAKAKAAAPAAAPIAGNLVPATGNKSLPFTGYIVSFGTTQIKNGIKPYTTYAMTIRSETGSYEKQFIGEHLADLVTDLSLREGQLVRIQLLGKHHFEVEVHGKMEPRCRNHFAIETL